ncbi:transmembrane protein, putative (macronuclear) [Tetrahymena thermophila SB210]|uniref:Transmembrane protein, putative n=1 Tax=Tetrahymena thermophila (strain SB210) TaxID=312017 RepID=W7XJN4_TETTS|nr:transmembrane protein, putative [Tetrahymena thermophila SB210]EWS75706.1 transmembrane protein, putative [Tetrahymena thermophila SB210]|eukprot:XP_012651779.1 transmembrane protein, putative [Tetrahymena thermophila SB210]
MRSMKQIQCSPISNYKHQTFRIGSLYSQQQQSKLKNNSQQNSSYRQNKGCLLYNYLQRFQFIHYIDSLLFLQKRRNCCLLFNYLYQQDQHSQADLSMVIQLKSTLKQINQLDPIINSQLTQINQRNQDINTRQSQGLSNRQQEYLQNQKLEMQNIDIKLKKGDTINLLQVITILTSIHLNQKQIQRCFSFALSPNALFCQICLMSFLVIANYQSIILVGNKDKQGIDSKLLLSQNLLLRSTFTFDFQPKSQMAKKKNLSFMQLLIFSTYLFSLFLFTQSTNFFT